MRIINRGYEAACPASRLKPHPANPRLGNEDAICASIEANGFYGAVVAQVGTDYILAGNHRWKSAIKKGADVVPVIWVECDEKTAKQILLADNRTNDVAGYNEPELIKLLQEMSASPGGLTGTGYDDAALRDLVDRVAASQPPAPGQTDDDAATEPPAQPASVLGDLWILGRHRLLCGDATQVDAAERLMEGAKADMVFTDPPYNVDYDPEARASYFSPQRKAHKLGKIKNDTKTPEAFRAFLDEVYGAIDLNLKPGGAIYICHADTEGHHFRNAFIAQPWKLKSCLIWKKTVLVFGRSDYHWMHEPILYGWKDGAPHEWCGDRTQTTIVEIATDHYDKPGSDTGGKYVHPTQKPVALIERALVNSSKTGDVVLDSFGGSGSTLIACEKNGRDARLMELDPRYVDVIVKRWQAFTGKAASLDGDGRAFDDLARARVPVAA